MNLIISILVAFSILTISFCEIGWFKNSTFMRVLGKRQAKKCAKDLDIINKILTPYNPNKIPGDSVEVEVEVWVQEVTTISDITSDFNLDIYISERWYDPELRYADMKPCKHNLSLTYKTFDKIWTPNSCFINSKEADIHVSPFKYENAEKIFQHDRPLQSADSRLTNKTLYAKYIEPTETEFDVGKFIFQMHEFCFSGTFSS